VALAGESEWVRNVRAVGGHVVLGRRDRRAATLVEVPPEERPEVLHAYLRRSPRRRAEVARHYFGVGADPSHEDLLAVADRYPVFRVVEHAAPADGKGPRGAGGPAAMRTSDRRAEAASPAG
jgi:hypothetical protein